MESCPLRVVAIRHSSCELCWFSRRVWVPSLGNRRARYPVK